MRFVSYCDIWDRRSALTPIDNRGDFKTSALPGAAIMRSVQAFVKPEDSEAMKVEALFQKYVVYLHMQSGWTWGPGGACRSPLFLDTKGPLAKECGAYAAGMAGLMITPEPFGLGIAATQVSVEEYSPFLGTERVGFVSRHPSIGVLGLLPNIYRAELNDAKLGENTGFYRWRNHKVVRYGGKLFDPTYGCQYEQLTDMAFLTITGFGIEGAETPSTFLRWDNEADDDETGNYFLLGKTSTNVTFRVKKRKRSLCAGFEYDGPTEVKAAKGEEEKKSSRD